jgi:DNA-binding transcriptional MocR family regulator
VPALEYGGTPIELSPMREWKTLMIKHCDVSREEQVAEMIDPLGLEKLREAIAAYVSTSPFNFQWPSERLHLRL